MPSLPPVTVGLVGSRVLIDWVTARVPLDRLSPVALDAARTLGDRIIRFCPKTGQQRFEIAAWDSIRSDSHQVIARAGCDLWMQGSPARVMGDGCTVFGSGSSAALDLFGCVDRMRAFLAGHLGVELPETTEWIVSRVDITENLCLADLTQVKEALTVLRGTEGGRYKVSSQSGDSVYWGSKSRLRKGKAYAKGPHLRVLLKNKSYSGRRYSKEEIAAADRLIRLELTLGREWFARNGNPQAIAPARLQHEWESYFGRMLGEAEVSDMARDIEERIKSVAASPGEAIAAYRCWLIIKERGWTQAKEMHTHNTWYRHLRVIRRAGLGDSDISLGQVVPFRRVQLRSSVVRSWPELLNAASA